ncbi:MAG: LuxR C-terminal-related transcriptional regulator [Prevotellaceae bacterium]|nr:LuxR C-terminal-related transcriptional regulator [Prevotellaceae bacterium]
MENRRQCMMSYDFHITHGDRLLLVNHKITPLAMTDEGRVWLALCTVSLSPHKEAGHIEFRQFATGEKREYSLEAHRWKNRETITLKPEEKQILTLSAQGYTMKEIAGQMLRSFDTVKFSAAKFSRSSTCRTSPKPSPSPPITASSKPSSSRF